MEFGVAVRSSNLFQIKIMKDSERIREEILTLVVFIITLAFTSSNLTTESLRDKSWTNNLPLAKANHYEFYLSQ